MPAHSKELNRTWNRTQGVRPLGVQHGPASASKNLEQMTSKAGLWWNLHSITTVTLSLKARCGSSAQHGIGIVQRENPAHTMVHLTCDAADPVMPPVRSGHLQPAHCLLHLLDMLLQLLDMLLRLLRLQLLLLLPRQLLLLLSRQALPAFLFALMRPSAGVHVELYPSRM